MNLVLNQQSIDAYKEILSNPSKYDQKFKPLEECFVRSEEAIAKHLLFQQFVDYIQKPLPKVIFYIIMDQMYGDRIGKADDGCLGYRLKLNVLAPELNNEKP